MNKIFLIIVSALAFNAYAGIDKDLCDIAGFDNEQEYLQALKNSGSYEDITSFFVNDCGYGSIDYLHSSSEKIVQIHSMYEREYNLSCVPMPYETVKYVDLFNYKRISNSSICFSNDSNNSSKYRVVFTSRFIELEKYEWKILGVIPQNYATKYGFEFLESNFYKIK